MAPYPHNGSKKGKPWPEYFLVRTTGEVVPLIAVDELPVGCDLVGVPRSLDLKGTIGMLNLGLQRSSGAFYELAPPERKRSATADLLLKTKASEPASEQKAAEAELSTPGQSSSRSTSTALASASPKYATRVSAPRPESQTCRHWCTHGICKWGQQCRYRHIMPMTLPGLQEIGLHDWPAWYRSLNPGYFASENLQQRPYFNTPRRSNVRGSSVNGHCSSHLGQSTQVYASQLKAERLRAAAKALKSGSEEKGVETLAKLRGLPKEKGLEAEGLLSRVVMLERASAEDVKDWEDEEDEEGSETDMEVGNEKERARVVKGSLLD